MRSTCVICGKKRLRSRLIKVNSIWLCSRNFDKNKIAFTEASGFFYFESGCHVAYTKQQINKFHQNATDLVNVIDSFNSKAAKLEFLENVRSGLTFSLK